MTEIKITASKREEFGKIAAKKLKKEGSIPVILYTKNNGTIHLSMPKKLANLMVDNPSLYTTLCGINVDGSEKEIMALVRDIQFDPPTYLPIHIDFMEVAMDDALVVSVPVEVINRDQSIGVKRGGDVFVLQYNVKLKAKISNMPKTVVIDVAGSNIGARYNLADLPLPEGVIPAVDCLVAKVGGKRVAAEATPADAAPEVKK